jgi:hypothetical protein
MVTFRQIYFADELPQRRVWRGTGVAACRGAFAPGTQYSVWARQRHEAVMRKNGTKKSSHDDGRVDSTKNGLGSRRKRASTPEGGRIPLPSRKSLSQVHFSLCETP